MHLTDLEMARKIAEAVAERGGVAYFVGGYVRDIICGTAGKDIDIEIHGISPDALKEILGGLGERMEIGESFGIFGLKGYSLDIAMPRTEINRGRGHKDFDVFVDPNIGTYKAAKRRDFTINAMMQNVLTGEIIDHFGGRNRYIGYLISMAKHSFSDLRIGLDCANGAAFMIAPAVFRALGATVVTIGDEPDGLNINRGFGSTNVAALCSLVRERGLDMGFAFDGDADRCIAVDSEGNEINGDKIAYILGVGMKKRGELFGDTVVTTVMSNAGLYRALDAVRIKSVQTAVGDRFIYEEMKKGGYSLGAEQSGHVIMSKYSVTGDGILTAIMLTEQVLSEKKSLGKLASPVTMLPQWTENIAVRDKSIADREPVKDELERIRGELGGRGRILVRKSGTESLIRIMAEADTEKECRLYALALRRVIEEEMRNEASAL